MISDTVIKADFIGSVLDRDLKNIYNVQLLIARNNTYISGKELKIKKRRGATIGVRTGALLQSLESPNYNISQNSENFIVTANIVKQMRFFDMKKFGNWKIYNRQVWPILYHNTLPAIRYNVGDNIRDILGETIQEAFIESK